MVSTGSQKLGAVDLRKRNAITSEPYCVAEQSVVDNRLKHPVARAPLASANRA